MVFYSGFVKIVLKKHSNTILVLILVQYLDRIKYMSASTLSTQAWANACLTSASMCTGWTASITILRTHTRGARLARAPCPPPVLCASRRSRSITTRWKTCTRLRWRQRCGRRWVMAECVHSTSLDSSFKSSTRSCLPRGAA